MDADGMRLACGCTRLVRGWHSASPRLACGWYAAGMRLACGLAFGWLVSGLRLACGWHAAGVERRGATSGRRFVDQVIFCELYEVYEHIM